MKSGDKILIHLYGHVGDGSMNLKTVEGRIVDVLEDGFIRAEIADDSHPLAYHNGTKRILICSPDFYKGLP